MDKLGSRQVHLDFHTSEWIQDIGSDFSKDNFQKALLLGNVNSITLFAKCHHGFCYYPTKIGNMHPSLKFDLLGAEIEAAREIGVKTFIYITVGWSSNDAETHPEWIAKNINGSIQTENYNLKADARDKKEFVSWKYLCPNGTYSKHIFDLTREICNRYDKIDGLFYDICFLKDVCYCDHCLNAMKKLGFDYQNIDEARKYNIIARRKFMQECIDIKNEKHQAEIFFNSGGADIYQPQWHHFQSHFEMEDLPTVWGGYDKMPMRASFFAKYGKECVGMTGKFHTDWGEFGGFKSPEALKFECVYMMMYGAKCSIGDQLHPRGFMDMETYRIIGEVYRYIEKIEPYCFDSDDTTGLGILVVPNPKNCNAYDGVTKLLLEKQLDFRVVRWGDSFNGIETLILPDEITINSEETTILNNFVENGGKLFMSGNSGLNNTKQKFMIDIGAQYIEKSPFDIDYVKVGDRIENNVVKSPMLFYQSANRVEIIDAEVLGKIYDPYFNRTYEHYCSHRNTPYNNETPYPSLIKKGSIVYMTHQICSIYNQWGAKYHKEYFYNALRLIYQPIMSVEMPSCGRAKLLHQQGRYVLHLLYAIPILRGIHIIEDMPPLFNIKVELKINKCIKKIRSLFENEIIAFIQEGETVKFYVPKVECHQIILIEYDNKL